jgi:hypothetical protein
MKKDNSQTILLIVIIAIVLIPTGVLLNSFVLDYYKRLEAESVVAYTVAADHELPKEIEPPPLPIPPVQTTCSECKGTRRVKTGDGLGTMPCDCGENCQCQKKLIEPLIDVKPPVVPVEPPPVKNEPITRLVYLKQPNCVPCTQMAQSTLKTMYNMGWDFGQKKQIEIIDISLDAAAFRRYNPLGLPCMIRLVDEKETNRYYGYINEVAMKKVWFGQNLSPEDKLYVPYKEYAKKKK